MFSFGNLGELNRLAAQLGKADAKVETLASAAVAKSTNDLAAIAQSHAPVDTGFLRGSIIARPRGLQGEVVSTANYSIYQEFGTSKMAAHPFMTPAVDAVEPSFYAAMERLVDMAW